MTERIVHHPHFGAGTLLKTYMSGHEWEVQFESGRRFRLPARQFDADSVNAVDSAFRITRRPVAPPPVTLPETDQFRARQTLEALRLGVVPVQDAETLTIGLEAERVTLERALERSRERGGDVLAVIGDYGFGKSHFVELAARRGLRENFIVAAASLDLVEVPPGKPPQIYASLVSALRYPDTAERGLAPLLKKAVETPGIVERFVALCPREPHDCPITAALLALTDCHSQTAFDEIILWLSRQITPSKELKSCLKKPPRLYITGETARQYSYLLTGISTLASLLGYSGLAVLIDESEHYSLLGATQRERADSFFKAMIVCALGLDNERIDSRDIPEHNRAEYPVMFSSEPHLFFMFALTESENRMPVGSWLAPSHLVRLDDRFIEKDMREFFEILAGYHSLAHGYQANVERLGDIVADAPLLLSRSLAQHRINLRELIRTGVTVLDLLFLYADYSPQMILDELRRGLKVS